MTIEQALEIAQFDNNDNIHCFPYSPYGILGMIYSKNDFIKILEQADSIEIGDDMARKMEHAIVVYVGKKLLYFEHNEDKLKEIMKVKRKVRR
ncbi:MAG: hypothetical protein II625_06205 [Bacilli bacterium]|nr:hypothetical protein [Bacilli bacterium]